MIEGGNELFQKWWARKGRSGTFAEIALSAWNEAAERERAACAAQARMGGCLCGAIEASLGGSVGVWDVDAGIRTAHDPRCPEAIAASIESRTP